ncbi:MAG: CHAP domain-containing protein, partial [Verrucomicrobiaceae bacterium]
PGTDGSLRGISVDEWVRRFAADSYALNFGGIKGVGHGLQCPSFVSMVLYRALGGYQSGNMNGKRLRSDGSAKNAQPGDVVFTTGGTWGHVGICVRNTGSFITVVDSNFVGGDGNEVIGRHDVSYAAIGSTWQLYSGRGRWY